MKNKQRGNSSIFFPVTLIIIVIACSFALEKASCTSKWEDSGMATRWGPIKGCVVQVPNGKWLPEDVIREIDLNAVKKEVPAEVAK